MKLGAREKKAQRTGAEKNNEHCGYEIQKKPIQVIRPLIEYTDNKKFLKLKRDIALITDIFLLILDIVNFPKKHE
jgi:hypothetical protein